MILNIYSLYDAKSSAYSTPFFMHHRGQAIRACIDLAGDMNTTVGRHPADFALFELGTFDDQTGIITMAQTVHLGSVLSLMPRAAPTTDLFNNGVMYQPRENANA